jgi:hypothetical protein
LAPDPTKRAAGPAEIAALVAFLPSDEAAFITGAALPIDGRATAHPPRLFPGEAGPGTSSAWGPMYFGGGNQQVGVHSGV